VVERATFNRVVKGSTPFISINPIGGFIFFAIGQKDLLFLFHINSNTYMKNYQGNYHDYRVIFLSLISPFCHPFLRLPNNAIIYVKLVYLNGRANLARRSVIVTLPSVNNVCASTSNSSSFSFSELPQVLRPAQLPQTPYTMNQQFFS
jgi:hypothetical protein